MDGRTCPARRGVALIGRESQARSKGSIVPSDRYTSLCDPPRRVASLPHPTDGRTSETNDRQHGDRVDVYRSLTLGRVENINFCCFCGELMKRPSARQTDEH